MKFGNSLPEDGKTKKESKQKNETKKKTSSKSPTVNKNKKNILDIVTKKPQKEVVAIKNVGFRLPLEEYEELENLIGRTSIQQFYTKWTRHFIDEAKKESE